MSRSSSSAARTAARPSAAVALATAGSPQGQPRRRRRHVVHGDPVPVLAVVVGQQGQPHGGGLPLLAQLTDEDQVAE